MMPTANAMTSTREKLEAARRAAPRLSAMTTLQKNQMLLAMAEAIESQTSAIIAANQKDLDSTSLSSALRDRLMLNAGRIAAMASGIREVAALPDPIGEIITEWQRPNGLQIRRVRVPLGVVGIIYESRPNVTVDTVALTIKTGNAIVLRGGKEAIHSNHCLVEILSSVPELPTGAIQLLDSSSRDSVQELIQARGLVDVIIPRGGAGLINFVVEYSVVPVIETGAGNCHIFIDESADSDMADRIVINAKTQRPSVCNAAEKLLIHRNIADAYLPRIAGKLMAQSVELRGDDAVVRICSGIHRAKEEDWSEEYLRLCIAIRIVSGLEDAIEHINRYSTKNSEAIVTSNEPNARRFLRAVDSAVVYWNASTRFTDGGEFGFGAEMGISTQKLHCRGPFALAELTSSKYEIVGNGQVRT